MSGIGKALEPAFDPAEVRALWRKLDEDTPAEKAKERAKNRQIAKQLRDEGGHKFDGGGQHVGAISLKTWIRWNHEFPGCWNDEAFRDSILKQNGLMSPGYYGLQKPTFQTAVLVPKRPPLLTENPNPHHYQLRPTRKF